MSRIHIDSKKQMTTYNSDYLLCNYKDPKTVRNHSYTTTCDSIFSGCDFIESTAKDAYNSINNKQIIQTCNTINKGDKIFFSDSTFPSLLLSRLGIDLKRTTKINSADKIVSDCSITMHDCFRTVALMDIDKSIVITSCSPKYCEKEKDYINRINTIIIKTNSVLGCNLKVYLNLVTSNFDTYENYLKNPKKFVTTKTLMSYVLSQLPVLKQAECENICDMLKSSDSATVTTGLGTLQYYNFADCSVDVLGALIASKCTQLPVNREAEYVYNLLGVSKSIIVDAKYYNIQRKIHLFMDVLNRFVVSPSMSTRDKVFTVLRGILFTEIDDKYKEEFNRLNVTLSLIPNDTNGETTTGTPEVEGV